MILYKKDGRNRLILPVLWREEWRVAAFPTEPKDTANDMSLANKQTFFIVCPTQTGTEIHHDHVYRGHESSEPEESPPAGD